MQMCSILRLSYRSDRLYDVLQCLFSHCTFIGEHRSSLLLMSSSDTLYSSKLCS